ncbi:hypothetical protein M407DRAFT_29541 [Tulasnella calospora MUT 4182]|uniref:Uncharacterized protein n=1 Tax=Tulasnella calospora MUT 4182 TaxID=1051891 RepID=A0A0C3Q9Y8_9AGAM|nr:hypothetical protein M407DRAFT_29541 [Tulasnella calospora MUT 4182]
MTTDALDPKSNDPDSHILDLPYDVLYLIFTFGCIQTSHKQHDFPVMISHVCRLWRQYALDTPGFWTSLRFKNPIPDIEKYRTWLGRSKNSPFDLEIGWRPFIGASMKHVKAIMRLVFPHIQRLRSLQVSDVPFKIRQVIFNRLNNVHLPSLETLHVKRGWSDDEKPALTDRKFNPFRHGDAANMKHVILEEIPYGHVIHRFKNLRTLSITNVKIFKDSSRNNAKTVQDILLLIPDLRLLHIHTERSFGHIPENPTLPPTTHFSLEELSFTATESDITAIVCALVLPSLRRICHSSGRDVGIDPCCLPIMARARLGHPHPNLLSLRLCGRQARNSSAEDSLNMEFLGRALAGLLRLESLELESVDLDHSRHLTCLSRTGPMLKKLAFTCCSGLVLKELQAVIQSRRDPKGMGSNSLEYVHVVDTLVTLQQLHKEAEEQGLGRDAGFNITISDGQYPHRIVVIGGE